LAPGFSAGFACGKFSRKLARRKWDFSAPRGIAKISMIVAEQAKIPSRSRPDLFVVIGALPGMARI
jgi:hypothetical protein